ACYLFISAVQNRAIRSFVYLLARFPSCEVPSEGNYRYTMVEDVQIPKPLLAAKFSSPVEMATWEKSLPKNERVPYEFITPPETKRRWGSQSLCESSLTQWERLTKAQSWTPTNSEKEKEALAWAEKAPITPITPLAETTMTSPVPLSSPTLNETQHAMHDVYEKAKLRGAALQRKKWVRVSFEISAYTLLILIIYFVLVGIPLWKGAVWWLYWVVSHEFVIQGGWAILIGLAFLYAFCPLLILFEKDPPPADTIGNDIDVEQNLSKAKTTALIIPCYKSAQIIGPTLEAALKIFPAENIFVIANGNSETPLDNTEEVCRPFGVNHLWVPIGSKIVAQFAGSYAADGFENVLLIDDDCALPANFPIVSDRLKGKVKCIGYTIKSVGPNSTPGTWCQQAQDMEYKMSGIQRTFFGMLGSATFPHGAISLWKTEFLKATFNEHPGYSVSEDWFFGDACRRLGGRITMCSSVFVETKTPSSVFFSGSGRRGGFGEMTVFKQRFKRWNFFFVIGMYYDMKYILSSWKLHGWEFGAKLAVWQEVYETLIYLLAPFMLPISFIVRPGFSGILLGATIGMYVINVFIFNEIHLRRKKERVSWVVLLFYYTGYKFALTAINVFSCYWSLYKYGRYFSKRHLKVVEDRQAIEVVMSLEKETGSASTSEVQLAIPENITIPEEAPLSVEPPLPGPSVTRKKSYKKVTLTKVEGPSLLSADSPESDNES
ncbi:hypothetical protein N7470_006221, partial [Penicillium chermesinum]